MKENTDCNETLRHSFIVLVKLFSAITAFCVCVANPDVVLARASHPTTLNEAGFQLIVKWEGFPKDGKAYKNPGERYYTIGYGHYGPDVYEGQVITQAKAIELLHTDIVRFTNPVCAFLDQNNISCGQNQFNALVSYTYNRGQNVWTTKEAPLEVLLKDGYQNHTAAEITQAFLDSWGSNTAAKKGLLNRRRDEAAVFLTGLSDPVPDNLVVDTTYPTPMTCYPLATSGKVTVYNAAGTAYSTSSRYIAPNDQCKILAVYTNGLCKVRYPSSSSSSGYRTEYARFSDFSSLNVTPYAWSPKSDANTYRKSDMAADFGSVWTTDSCKVIATKGNLLQIIYPLSGGGYKLGWVSTEGIPKPDPLPDQVDIPGPVAEGIFDGKSIVVMAPNKITFNSDEHISAGDVCIIKNVDRSTGYCTVTYPSGSTDVFATGAKTKDKTVAMTEFVEYQPDFKTQKLTTDVKVDAFPSSALQTYGKNWYLDAGDEYHTCARSAGGATEVLYYCTHGAHQGYWKLGWVDLPYYWLDLNGWLDGESKGDLGAYGAADVYVNGNKLAANARDFYSANGTFPRGSSYEIKDVVAAAGYAYNGVHSGSLSGTLKSNTSVSLDFSKDPSYCSAIRIKQNPNKIQYVEGEEFDPTGLLVDAVAIDGSGSDVTSKCTLSGYDSTPGVKTVVASYNGKTTSFTVVVSEKSPKSIMVTSLPTKTAYEIGEELDLAGIEVTVRYNNGTSAAIEDYDAGAEEDAMLTPGTKTIPVSYSHNGTEVSTSFEITVVSSSVAAVGDINGDGSVNNKDLTRLFQYLSDWDVEVVEENLDTNGDGSVNNKDVTRLFQYLSDWDVELHGGTN